jgi:ferredoxin-type protein NapH
MEPARVKMKKNRFYRQLDTTRRMFQILTLLFLLSIPVLHWTGVYWIIGNLYSLSIGALDITDPAMALQSFLLTRQIYVPLLIAVVLPVLLTIAFGRVFCSWICPHNTFSEWINALERRFPGQRRRLDRRSASAANPRRWLFWGIFAAFFLAVFWSGRPLIGYVSMPGIISNQISRLFSGVGLNLELSLVILILGLEVLIAGRIWCKYLCPVGATLSLFRIRGTMQLNYSSALCQCGIKSEPCRHACPLKLSPKEANVYPACFNCGLCIEACEKTGHRSMTFRIGSQKEKKQLTSKPVPH